MRTPRTLQSLLLTLMFTSVAACGNEQATAKVEPAAKAAAETVEPAPAAVPTAAAENPAPAPLPQPRAAFMQPWTGDLDGMEERRVVRVLTVYGTGRYYLENGQEMGLIAEFMSMFEDFLNERMGRKHMRVYVVVIPVARDQLIPALLAGRGDIIAAGLTITEERKGEVTFTIPTSKPIKEVLVTGPSAPPLDSAEDLAGQSVHVRFSSSYRASLERLSDSLVAKGLAPIQIEPISELLEDDDLIEMVNGGLLPWAVVDSYKTQLWDGVFDSIKVRDDIVLREGERLAWAIRPDSPQLEAAANEFLKDHREGTLMGNILRNRYIRDFDYAANALDDADYQRFRDLVSLFQAYGDDYNIEHLLAAAQGYQESRLDQSVRSAAGAIGIMQLLPSTAADPNVGIPDISSAEANIHAGIKYLSFLRERYFSDPEIDKLNQQLLALAAYNAGPARVRDLRAEAAAEGYDPNVWFDNVEVIAARRIGRETVQYVANIYKYYLGYRLAALQQSRRAEAREAAGVSD